MIISNTLFVIKYFVRRNLKNEIKHETRHISGDPCGRLVCPEYTLFQIAAGCSAFHPDGRISLCRRRPWYGPDLTYQKGIRKAGNRIPPYPAGAALYNRHGHPGYCGTDLSAVGTYNFEIVATAVIALVVFSEAISPRLWLGILFVTASCALLSFEDLSSLQFNSGSLFALLACICWGIENNCTRRLSSKDPLQIVMVKGICSGTGSIIIGFLCGERILHLWTIPAVLLLGFVAYGLSIYFYVYAQRILGAARTSAYYAVAPFIGVFLSLLIFREVPGLLFIAALILMIVGAWLSSQDKPLKITLPTGLKRVKTL